MLYKCPILLFFINQNHIFADTNETNGTMQTNGLEKICFSDFQELSASYMIKNFIISNFNEKAQDKISLNHPFSFDGIIFAIILKGSGKIKINYKEYQTEKNTILMILPSQIVEMGDASEDFSFEMLAFSPDFLSNLVITKDIEFGLKISKMPLLNISEEEAQNLLRYHSFIINTFNNNKDGHQIYFGDIIKGHLYSLLLEIATLYNKDNVEIKEKASTRNEEIVEKFLYLLKENYKNERTATYYAEKMFLSPKYLSSTLKKVTGRPIISWIEESVIINSKILLKSTNLTVLQISEELNFPNPSYFGRFFKKHTGMTPRCYREMKS